MPGTQRELTLRFLAEPTDVNYGGKVFGGAVMKWIDQAGYALAVGWCGRYAVTVYVGGIQFENPIAIGSLVAVRARVLHTGTTSIRAPSTPRCAPRTASSSSSPSATTASPCRCRPMSR